MAVPFRFIRSRNPNTTLRGALKVNAIFATDNAPGTEPFQGWLADNTVVTSFNDALIENEIGVVDTNEFNPNQSNKFAFTTMSEGQEIDEKNLVLVEFQNPIDPTASTFNKGDILEFVSNALPFGTLDAPSEGKSYRIFGTLREKDVRVEGATITGPDVEGFYTITLDTDPRENLQAFTQSTSTGLNIQIGDSVVIFDNQTTLNGTSTSLNGTYVLTGVTATSIEYKTNVDPVPGGDSFQSGGKFYKIQNELLLTEVLRAEATGLSYNAGDTELELATAATLRGTVAVGQFVTGPGIEPETIVISYSNTTQRATLANLQSPPADPITTSQGGVTVNFNLENPQNDIVIPDGSTAALTSPTSFIDAGSVTDSRVIKLPTNYYVYGDARLKYFWASYNPTGTLEGWDQNIVPDGVQTLYNSGIQSSGATEQLIGTTSVVDDEDTFNNAIKTLAISRGSGIGGDYTSTGRAALLYISATDSQGGVGAPGGGNKSRSTSTPGYTVRETIDTINSAGGYWIGVVGGSFFQDNGETCQNEIRPFRQDSSDGILGDPRGFTPLKGEVVTARIGNPIAQSEDNATGDPVGTTRVTTYYDHGLGNPGDQVRVRIKNNNNTAFVLRGADGLVDVVVVDDKNFYFVSTFGSPTTITPTGDFDNMGYVLNVTQLLNVPLGFYRKSTFEYVDPTLVNDSRSIVASGADGFTLSEQPGVGTGLDRKEILVTLQVTQTSGTLQFFSSYPVGDFFLNLPATDAFGEPYFAYPIDSDRDIKFKVKTQNSGGEPFTTIRDTANVTGSDLLDPGNNSQSEVTPGEEIPILLYPIEYTAIVQAATGDVLTIPNSSIAFLDTPNSQLARDFTSLTTGGAGYDDGSGDTPNDFSATNVATTGGGNNDLTVDIVVESGAVTAVTLNERGTGYSPGDVLDIEANVGGTVVTKATITLKTITDWTEDWTIEVIDTDYLSAGDDFFENTDNWSNPNSLISKTQLPVANIVDNLDGTSDLTLLTPGGGAGAVTGNPVNSRIVFCYPRNDKQINVFVKTTNNFKDISITDAQFNALEAEQPGKGATDVSVTFTGYGYAKGDILTPSEVTNPPVDIVSAVWDRITEITEDGFTFVGASISGTTLYEKGNLTGNQEGSGAAFNVRNTVTGLYSVELSDAGADFQIGERIIIPGYELGGSTEPRSAELLTEGSGAAPEAEFTGQPGSATTGTGTGLAFDLTTNATGGVDPATLRLNFGASPSGYNIGDEGEILLAGATVNPTYKITGTENDLIITVREVANNSNVTIVTATPHGFVPSLGRTTVDIVVKDIVASGAPEGNFNGRKIAQVVGNTTLKYDQLLDPGTYVSGGQVINVSPDVINDSFAVYANKLFLNLNTDSNDPVYPYLRFIDSATINTATTPDTITITTTDPHLLTTGDEVSISNIVSDRGANWNTAKSTITVTGANTFTYQKDVAQAGNAVSSTGEVTNPYVKVLGGVYTKDFFRIVFVNTDTITQDGILPDKTQDFLVRDINFKQISNDNNDVKDGDEHYFYVTSSNEIIIINRISSPTTITPIFESSEYEVVTSTPHGLLPGNKIDITILSSDGGPLADYNTPGGAADPDVVTAVPDSTTFRYKIFTADRTLSATPVSANVTGNVEKLIGVGSAFEDTYFGPTGGISQDIAKLKNLKGFPGVNSNDEYYLVTTDETNQSGTTEYITLQLSTTKSGSAIVWSLDIDSATYDKTTENAVIEVASVSPHNLSVGDQVSITGVSSDDYNGIQTLTEDPISPTIFTYQVPPLSADPDPVSTTSIDIFTTVSTAPRLVTKRCESFSNEVLEIRSGGGRIRDAEGIVKGMEVTGPGINTGANGRAYVQSFTPSTRQIILEDSSGNPYVTSTSEGGGGSDFDFESGTATSFAIALDQNTTNLDDIAVGQFINGTGIATNSTKITGIYDSSVEVEAATPTYYYITIDTPLVSDLSAGNNPFTLSDNLQGGQSLRVTNVLPSGAVPKVGAEIETINGSGNVLPGGTLVTEVVPTTAGGYIISVDSNLIANFTDQEIRIFPDTNAGAGGKVSPVIVPIIGTPSEPENPDTSFGGTIQLTADIAGWDHVSLAKETGGAIFFQLGFSDLATGSFNANTITTNSNISANLNTAIYGDDGDPVNSPVGIGVYGDGIAPGAIITSVVGQTITLDKPNVGVVNGYVGFARPDSVSVFPKYTSEFGRILGKTFAEWLFKIA